MRTRSTPTTRAWATGSSPTNSPTPGTGYPSAGCGRSATPVASSPLITVGGAARAVPGRGVHDDLVQRRFTADGPNRVWLTDIPPQAGGAPTEHPTAEGVLYLCAVKDVWSRRIVGYSIADRMASHLAVNALEMAVDRRGPAEVAGCVVHADRGSQFRSRPFLQALERYRLRGSMGRVASSADNAAMESFFALLRKERPELPPMAHPARITPGDSHLDREDLPPAQAPTRPRHGHTDRV